MSRRIVHYPRGVYYLPNRPHPSKPIGAASMDDRNYTVTGMTCGHCRNSLIEEVLQVSGVRAVDVDLDSGTLTVRGDELDDASIHRAVDEAGFAVA